ncbi:hypothetical protein DFP72DRAFT_1013170 [Ephemerocybe angulata]|uniref:Uncharacterized protein n=1 Tax=Ephemerocybe angulata TaxID=980116 RepID=A0A8H6HPA0_9AGAR|nr:hypothetical protein DFP72DRAFT_1013170 [Tulosesus angulatus]
MGYSTRSPAHPTSSSHAPTAPSSSIPSTLTSTLNANTNANANGNANANAGIPPPKRRRAKRTEEERIDYLRADPYVAQFEAYRVLCASCDKWIRLRPNSTYCSIPWDAHRKSCLAKKINNKNAYALEERNTLFTKDPDIRKFDAERVLCNRCDQWLGVPADDHRQAVQKWLVHRAACGGGRAGSHPSSSGPSSHPGHPSHSLVGGGGGGGGIGGGGGAGGGAPSHESRRRNAEQRAAMLRADALIGEVEPNRVFCVMCRKWVQLRQDSSFCAYPWVQHRGKCLKRSTRRLQKQAELAELKRRPGGPSSAPIDVDIDIDEDEDELAQAHYGMGQRGVWGREEDSYNVDGLGEEGERDAEGDVDADGESCGDESELVVVSFGAGVNGAGAGGGRRAQAASGGRMVRVGLADLDSPAGRYQFLASSIHLLFSTTYEASDDMPIAALLTYLNAAMPVDKHEDFDTSEVVRYVAALVKEGDARGRGAGRVVLEGDVVRLSA